MKRSAFFATLAFMASVTAPVSGIAVLNELQEAAVDDLDQVDLAELDTAAEWTGSQKIECWNNAKLVSGRDGKRWRKDIVGNPVLKGQHGAKYKNSPYAWNYDRSPSGKCRLL